jgi:hypothetical protein
MRWKSVLPAGLVYSGPIRISGTTTIRAGGFLAGYQPSDIDTQTYVFLDDVIRQASNGQAPPGWPASWGANTVDYGMDLDLAGNGSRARMADVGSLEAAMALAIELAERAR